jgi:hypothetical protein
MMIPIKMYDHKNSLKLKMMILNIALNFMFVCNPKKNPSVMVQNVPLFMFSPCM